MAGAGTGSTPCSVFTVPLPTLSGEQKMRSTPSSSKRQARADDVGDGIHRADLVKMNLFDGSLVNGGFRFAEPLKHGGSVLLYAVRHATLPRSYPEFPKDAGASAAHPHARETSRLRCRSASPFRTDTDAPLCERAQPIA